MDEFCFHLTCSSDALSSGGDNEEDGGIVVGKTTNKGRGNCLGWLYNFYYLF